MKVLSRSINFSGCSGLLERRLNSFLPIDPTLPCLFQESDPKRVAFLYEPAWAL